MSGYKKRLEKLEGMATGEQDLLIVPCQYGQSQEEALHAFYLAHPEKQAAKPKLTVLLTRFANLSTCQS